MPKRKCRREEQTDKRKKRFDSTEIEVLIQGVTEHKEVLFSSITTGPQAVKKKYAWNIITDNVNAVSVERRTTAEVKKKWFDLKSDSKKKIAEHRRDVEETGGGGPSTSDVSQVDERIVTIIGETAVSGVPGTEALDTDVDFSFIISESEGKLNHDIVGSQ